MGRRERELDIDCGRFQHDILQCDCATATDSQRVDIDAACQISACDNLEDSTHIRHIKAERATLFGCGLDYIIVTCIILCGTHFGSGYRLTGTGVEHLTSQDNIAKGLQLIDNVVLTVTHHIACHCRLDTGGSQRL